MKTGKKHARPSQAGKPKTTKAKTPKKTAKTKPSKEPKKKVVKKTAKKPVAAVAGLARQATLPTASAPAPGPSKQLKKSSSKKPTLSRTASRSTASGFYVPPKEEWPIEVVSMSNS